MINNAVLVSGVQQSASVLYTYIYIYIHIYIYILPGEEETDDAGREQDVARF